MRWPCAVERRQRHQHDIGNEFGGRRRRLEDAERPQHQPVVGRPGAKRQRFSARHYRRQRQLRALLRRAAASGARDRSRCGSASSRRRPCRAQSRTARRAWRSACAAAARCSSLNASRLASAAVRRSAFDRVAVMQRYLRCHHPPRVITRESGRSSIPETFVIEPRRRGVLDTPLSRGMTGRARVDKVASNKTKVRSRDAPLKHSIPEFPTKVGGHHMTGSTDPARDSSLKDR